MAIVRGREGRVGTAGSGWRLCGIRVIGWGVGVGVCMLKERFGGLSAPRRQPLNPCRPEWWCLS